MFKKIEIWILYLILLLGIPVTIGFGTIVRHELLGGTRLGRVSKTALFLAEIPSNIGKVFKGSDLLLPDRFPDLNGFKSIKDRSAFCKEHL